MAVVLVLLYVVRASHGLRHRWKFRDKMSLHRLHYQRGGPCTVYVGVSCTGSVGALPSICRECLVATVHNGIKNSILYLISSHLVSTDSMIL